MNLQKITPNQTITEKKEIEMLIIPFRKKSERVPFNEVLLIRATGNYSVVYTVRGQKYFTSKTLKYWQTKFSLSPFFVRCHANSLVNVDYISKYNQDVISLVLTDGSIIPCSRRKWLETKESIYNMNFGSAN